MCERMPDNRASMWYVVHQLQSFAGSPSFNKSNPVDSSTSLDAEAEKNHSINDYIVPRMTEKVEQAMPLIKGMCESVSKTSMLKFAFRRLSHIYSLLQTANDIKDAVPLVKAFVSVLDLLYILLMRHQKDKCISSTVAIYCASRAAAQDIAILHHEIDRLVTLAKLQITPARWHNPPSHVTITDIREDSSIDRSIALKTFISGCSHGTKSVASNSVPSKHASRTQRD
ncbi:unnamed protein product [Phytophthora lilii]|uniref:Unnamed protein product n=1 Tax=Phytophthora lilii TaxID=2077276 RepID=A0A9W6TEJ9_9STRA|nr:unnamed protein product [Phytophthora lilii]